LKSTFYSPKKIAVLGLLLAVIIILLMIERMLPPLPIFPPNFKLGLSNIIVMFTAFSLGGKDAFTLGVLKGFFNTLLRGTMAGLLSLSGGLISITVILLLNKISKGKISIIILSVLGAISHNMGQLAMASFLMGSHLVFIGFLPVLLIAGAVLGTLTGIAAKIIMPRLSQLMRI